MKKYSLLQQERYKFQPNVPKDLIGDVSKITIQLGQPTESISDQSEIKGMLPKTYGKPIAQFIKGANKAANDKINVGVVLSGGQAPGGHNVIAGLFDGIKNGNKESKLWGFLKGPGGILENQAMEITNEIIDQYRNTGGFDIIGSGRTKIESEKQFAQCLKVCQERKIAALVIIGGDDSNTNAALMAEYFAPHNIKVIGVPKTIDGDLKNEYIETSFGFDTATKIYSELIGNIARDANSAKKYWHFIKLMGRSASHICLECQLQTQVNYAIISEEIEKRQKTLSQIVSDLVDVIVERSNKGENFGIVLVPEGLIEFIPEMKNLISELNDLLADHASHFTTLRTFGEQASWVNKNLDKDASYAFSSLPADIQKQLLMDRDPHGNVQVSRIETEKLLIEMVESKLNQMKNEGTFKGKFSSQHHFLGYEGRSAFPSNFDANYCYSLGYSAFLLIANGLTGYICSIRNLHKPVEQWIAGGVPISMLFNLEKRHGKNKPVIKKALVDLVGKPYKTYLEKRYSWAINTSYVYPGAIQYYGPDSICNQPTITLQLEHEE
ncbi:MAG: diphosphate--fructose-6-phosphate 1-phosphotransferase [Spirochaetes bacterium]|nr:diphosphate--fructose-6-phosphate 1-phosphotransferase [Spirochaetota bacterium]